MTLVFQVLTAFLPMLVVFACNIVIDTGLGLYELLPSLDIFMHALGGFVSAWSGLRLWRHIQKNGGLLKPSWIIYVLLIGWTSFVGVLWEFYEYFHDVVFPFASRFQPSLRDTMADFLFDILGAVAFCFIVSALRKKKKR